MIYDDNPDNGFTIFINHKDGKIQSVENTFQMDPSSLKQINSSSHSSQNLSEAFSQDVLNYSDGISKIMNTAFSAEDYTDQPESLSEARSMTASWDGLLSDIENQADTDEEQRIVEQLQGFKMKEMKSWMILSNSWITMILKLGRMPRKRMYL